jgi:hypothetical protein
MMQRSNKSRSALLARYEAPTSEVNAVDSHFCKVLFFFTVELVEGSTFSQPQLYQNHTPYMPSIHQIVWQKERGYTRDRREGEVLLTYV